MSYTELKMKDVSEVNTDEEQRTSKTHEERMNYSQHMWEERLQAYRNAFALFDISKTNRISCSDLKKVLQSLGKNPTDEEVAAMLASVDISENTYIEFKEFVEVMEKAEKVTTTEHLVREAFSVMDPDGKGYITLANLKQVIASIGFDFTSEEIQDMVDEADPNKTGKVEYRGLIGLISEENETLAKAHQKRVKIEETEREEARRPEAVRATFETAASKTGKDVGVPDMAEIASQFDHGQYDKFSRKVSRNGIITKRTIRNAPMTRTRLTYLQRKKKSVGNADYTEADSTGNTVSCNIQSQGQSVGIMTKENADKEVNQINTSAQDDRGFQDPKSSSPTKVNRNVDHRLLDPNYYLRKTKDSSKISCMHLGHIHSMSDEFGQELRKLRNIKVNPNDNMPRSVSMKTKPSTIKNNSPLSFTEESKKTRIAKNPPLTLARKAEAKEEMMNTKLYAALWRTAFANALEILQVNKRGMIHLSTPDLTRERLQQTILHNSNRQNIVRAEKQNDGVVSVISPFLDAPPKNTVQESSSFRRFNSNGAVKMLRKMQVPVNQHEKYHRDFIQPNILPRIEPRPKMRDVITKSDLHRIINSLT